MLAYGPYVAEALLKREPGAIRGLYVQTNRRDARAVALLEQAEAHGISVHHHDRAALDKMAGHVRHQGVVVEYVKPGDLGERELETALMEGGAQDLWLVLDQVQDPHNLGACLRSAAAVGVRGVVTTRHRSAPLGPGARKASSGAADLLPLYRVTNLARTLAFMRAAGITVAGTDAEAAVSIYEAELTWPLAWVVGAEGQGLRRLTREGCDLQVKIPLAPEVESLNVSVAAALCLFEARRRMPLG